MQIVEKIRWILLIILFILIILWLVVPTIRDSDKQNKVTQNDVEEYIKDSEVVSIDVDNIEIINKDDYVDYTNPTFTNRHSRKKAILSLKDKKEDKYYLIELYYTNNLGVWVKDIKNNDLYLIVNKKELQDQGSENNPIIVLRYYTDDKSMEYFINDEEYKENVKIYLTYKDYPASSITTLGIRALITALIIAGLLICTYIMKKQNL